MIELFKLDHSLNFPAHQLALNEPNGLLAFGGDLSPERLVHAYTNGIFPWYSAGEPILWWSPNPRGVLMVDNFKPTKSLKKSIRKYAYTATMNHAFERVIHACATVPRHLDLESNPNQTWITDEMIHAYIDLHYMGKAHSVEVWNKEGELVGGLYGIGLNSIFCGESMFHHQTDASKVALWALVALMKKFDLPLIDCQMTNDHLISLGCEEISRDEFLPILRSLVKKEAPEQLWSQQKIGVAVKFGITQKFTCSYLPEKEEQLLVCMLPSEELNEVYPRLVNLGFRRSGEQLYRPHCGECTACHSLRILCKEFQPSKSQKRIINRNKHFTVNMRFDERDDYYPLYEKYIDAYHQDGSMFPANYEQYSSFIRCQWQKPLFLEVRDEEKLIAVAVTDKLRDGLSALYTFYHPDYHKHSLGTFMIMEQIKASLSLDLDFLYLGYQIDDCRKMNYKDKFKPHQRFIGDRWILNR